MQFLAFVCLYMFSAEGLHQGCLDGKEVVRLSLLVAGQLKLDTVRKFFFFFCNMRFLQTFHEFFLSKGKWGLWTCDEKISAKVVRMWDEIPKKSFNKTWRDRVRMNRYEIQQNVSLDVRRKAVNEWCGQDQVKQLQGLSLTSFDFRLLLDRPQEGEEGQWVDIVACTETAEIRTEKGCWLKTERHGGRRCVTNNQH